MSRAARRAFEEQYNYERVFQPVLDRLIVLSKQRQSDSMAQICKCISD
jgi:hypothetical protein